MDGERSFGLWVRRRRRELGLTQAALADMVGCSAVTVRKLEADERRASDQMAERLARFLEIGPNERAAFLSAARGAAPAPTTAAPATLPRRAEPLVGREEALAAVCNRLQRPELRMLTLTGPGGVGKTSLALAAAAALGEAFPGGRFFIPLAAVARPDDVPAAVALALDVADAPGRSPLESVAARLAGARALLLMDNLEQVAGCAPWLAALLAASPATTLLATSRGPLRLPAEHTFAVPPLALPPVPRAARAPHDPAALDAIAESPAVELFVRRAGGARPGLAFEPDDMVATAAVCLHLGGLPLAIELVAARCALLAPAEILARLGGGHGYDPLDLAQERGGERPERQRTLWNAIAWSYDLLPPPERRLFAWLGAFAGAFSPPSAEAVCAAAGMRPVAVLDGLAALRDAGLLVEAGLSRRLELPPPIRAFARERLAAAGELGRARAAHAAHFLALAQEADAHFARGEHEHEWRAALDGEHDNLAAAIEGALAADDLATAARLGSALWWFWYMRGSWQEGLGWLRRLLAAGPVPAPLRADLHKGAGTLAKELALPDEAEASLRESAALFQAAGDERGRAAALNNLAGLLHLQGRLAEAEACYRDSLAVWERLDIRPSAALTRANLGALAVDAGRLAEADALYAAALDWWRAEDNLAQIAIVRSNQGQLALLRGDSAGAAALLEEGLAIQRELADRRSAAASLALLAAARATLGDLGALGLAQGALREYAELGDRHGVVECLECAADLIGRGGALLAAELYGCAEAQRRRLAMPLLPAQRRRYDEAQAAAAAAHPPARWAAAKERGRRAPVERMVEAVLGL